MPRFVTFHVTERCGLSCRHCLRDPGKAPADLPLAVVEKVLDEAGALLGVRHAGFTGGDPLLWPHLRGALDAVTRRAFTWHLVTSGRGFQRLLDLLDEAPARRDALVTIDISLDGATEGTHDGLRGHGSHRDAMSAIAACSARGIPFALLMTVNPSNQHEIEKAALTAAEFGAKQMAFAMTNASGNDEDACLYMSPRELDRVRDRVERLSTLVQLPVTLSEGFRRETRFHVCGSFASEVLHVTPHGKLNLCCNHSGIPGGEEDVVADLSVDSFHVGHQRLLDLVHRLQRERLDAIAASPRPTSGWDDFPCNRCLASLGKPHWVDGGSAGPRASRAKA